MNVEELTNKIKDVITVRQVYGEPYEKDDITIIPVAMVLGGGGGGDGSQTASGESEQRGSGAGMGFIARPTGVYVIRKDNVTWKPAIDVTQIVIGFQIIALITARRWLKKTHRVR
jgi:uncharacterized spore protein YtfJ